MNQCRLPPFGRHWFLLSYSRRQIAVPYYSGLTKTSTALPRLAVLFVLSAASSPCPDFC
ncbi:hypothetical protein [Neisseria meningitidis]|uniref:hypothetical protein n=1 Tax=Neisseria meningitidis TaxID=487 RepID=UPI0002E6A0FB|nr:hypothetical protein [Neisseria meningitidis]MBH5765174.1 hypothetical protein [Neisseria meningitidis]MBW3867115.1 hypothetical protein [Neisseria meningitidis]MCL5854167.1 hypothetical protein [Neisseria meningitidis]MCL5916565.1 hypothetical protein [Neisseria meningitidis]